MKKKKIQVEEKVPVKLLVPLSLIFYVLDKLKLTNDRED